MEHGFVKAEGTREEQYLTLIPQIRAILQGENDMVANMANVSACLKQQFGWLWVGFYIVKNDELVLGPFQGPVACTRIRKGKGVCGTSWEKKQTIVVEDVNAFPGHIACSSLSKSEIVVPLLIGGNVMAVLDIDSELLADFGQTDKNYLEEIAGLLVNG